MLPKHCWQMMIGFLLLALLMSLMRDLVPTRFAFVIPVPMAMAIPFYVGAHVTVSALIGALVKAYWHWTAKEAAYKVRLLMWQHLHLSHFLWLNSFSEESRICMPMNATRDWQA